MDAQEKSFGEWLREQMALRDLSQADVARRADLSRQAISDYVNGNRTNPDSDALNGIARALKLPPEEVHRAELAKADAEARALAQVIDPVAAGRQALDARLQLEQPDFRSRQLAVRGLVQSVRAVRLKGERRISGEIVAVLPGTDIETVIPLG